MDKSVVVFHNAGLSSGVALAMAKQMYGDNVVSVSLLTRLGQKAKAAVQLAQELGVQAHVYLPRYSSPATRTAELLACCGLAAERIPEATEYIFGWNKDTIDHTVYHLMSDMVLHLHERTIRAPLQDLEFKEVVEKAVDFELSLNLLRDCSSNQHGSFCGRCKPCRIRINTFRSLNYIDYDYGEEIDWELPPKIQAEYRKWLEGGDINA